MGKKVLTLVAVGAMLALLAIPAASYLQIDSPVSATIDIDSYGSTPAMDLIDKAGTGTGAKCAYLDTNDNFIIDFSTDSGADIVLSRNQEVQFGDSTDWVFRLKNTSGQSLNVDIVAVDPLPSGVLIKFVEAPVDAANTESADNDVTTGEDDSVTMSGDSTGGAEGNFDVDEKGSLPIDDSMIDGEVMQFHIIVKTDNASEINPTWNWTIKAVGS